MKTRHLRTLVCAWALCSAVFLCASDAKAATIAAQTTNEATCVVNGGGCAGQYTQISPVGTGVVESAQLYFANVAPFEFQASTPDGQICQINATSSIGYAIYPCDIGSQNNQVYSTSTITATLRNLSTTWPIAGYNNLPNGSGFNFYFELFDASGNEGSLSRFVEPYSPSNGSFSTTSPTTFSTGYYFNCDTDFGLYDSLTFQITDTSNPNRNPVVSPQPLSVCGGGTLSAAVTLTPGDTYLWRPEMYSSAGSSTPLFGNYYFFDSTSTPAEDINTAVGATVGTSTLPTTTNLLSFLNVPVLLETKFPFAYIFQVADGIKAGITASSTDSIPSGAFVWSNFTGGTTTTDFFSQATIEYYLSPTLVSLWRSFLVVLLYVGVGYALYHRARHDLNLK